MKKIKTVLIKEKYDQIKLKHNNPIIFFQDGEYYEILWEDAKIVSSILNLQLTSYSIGKEFIPHACFFYYTALDLNLTKLMKAGHRVAIYNRNKKIEARRFERCGNWIKSEEN